MRNQFLSLISTATFSQPHLVLNDSFTSRFGVHSPCVFSKLVPIGHEPLDDRVISFPIRITLRSLELSVDVWSTIHCTGCLPTRIFFTLVNSAVQRASAAVFSLSHLIANLLISRSVIF